MKLSTSGHQSFLEGVDEEVLDRYAQELDRDAECHSKLLYMSLKL